LELALVSNSIFLNRDIGISGFVIPNFDKKITMYILWFANL
jgi:hypothetical protein